MMAERGISEDWVRQAVEDPDSYKRGLDARGPVAYYWKRIQGMSGEVLKVTISVSVTPRRVITLHPDRAMRREMKRKGLL